MKSLKLTREGLPELLLLEALVLDAGLRCGRDLSRDIMTLQRRVEGEGLSFLFSTMPVLDEYLTSSLEQGMLQSVPMGWRTSGFYPAFLRPLWEGIFDPKTLLLLDEPCVDCILAIRQIVRCFKKIEVPCRPEAYDEAFQQYIATDEELVGWAKKAKAKGFRRSMIWELFGYIGDVLWSGALQPLDEEIANATLHPRHGSGATADGHMGNAKYSAPVWFRRLDRIFPSSSYLVPNLGAECSLDQVAVTDCEPYVKVTAVPKTPKKPRIIAVEHTAMQYVQQAIMQRMYDLVDAHPVLSKVIGFRDQSRNQEAALRGSLGHGLATLDLSEASDRVHRWHVARMFKSLPNLREGLFVSRTPYAKVPGRKELLRLEKFASMGSATCFPVETMLFLQIVLTAELWDCGHVSPSCLRPEQIWSCLRRGAITVFGDDIVCRAKHVDTTMTLLEAFGLRVNLSKSFHQGKFRESCGADWFDGVDVKPVYLRQPFPVSRRDASSIQALVATSDQLFEKGWWLASDFLRHYLTSLLGPLPLGDGLGCLHFKYRAMHMYGRKKWDNDVQTWKTKVWVSSPAKVKDPLEGYPALMKFFLQAAKSKPGLLFNDRGARLDESDKPYSAKLYRRWLRS